MKTIIILCVTLCLEHSAFGQALWSTVCNVPITATNGTTTTASARMNVQELPANCQQHGTSVYCEKPTFRSFPQTFPLQTACIAIESGLFTALEAADLKYLRHLRTLAIVKTPILETSGSFGKEHPNLETLVFRNTSLSAVPSIHGNIKTLEVSASSIVFLYLGSLVGSELQTLNLSNNPAAVLDHKYLDQLPKTLETLDFLDCPIDVIDRGTFPTLPSLKILRVSAQTVKIHAFQGLSNVASLELDTCRLNSFSLQDLKNVVNLDLSYSCKTGSKTLLIERYAFTGMDSLTTLSLDNSGLKQIPTKAFSGLPTIHSISLRYNPLRYIMQGAFDGLTSLREILISDVAKEKSEHNMVLMGDNTFSFANLPSLTVLDISSLNLWNITLPTFRNLPSLEVAYFNSNLLHFLTNGTLAIPKLQKVRLGDNPWRCDCFLRWLKDMLDSQPEIFEDRPYVTCAAPPNLAGNRFIDLAPEDFKCESSVIIG